MSCGDINAKGVFGAGRSKKNFRMAFTNAMRNFMRDGGSKCIGGQCSGGGRCSFYVTSTSVSYDLQTASATPYVVTINGEGECRCD